MSGLNDLGKSVNSLLYIREKIGAVIKPVFIIYRVWSGGEIGAGEVKETEEEVRPAPKIANYSQKLVIAQSGTIKQGDLIIQQISKYRYPEESDVDGSPSQPGEEVLYRIGEHYYRVISVVEHQFTWDVQVRRLSDQTVRI